jgi:hypothetical protein
MRYLIKLFIASFTLWPIISNGDVVTPIQDGGDKINLFGYQFVSKSLFAGVKNYRVVEEKFSIGLKILKTDSESKAESYIGDKLAIFKSIFETRRVDYPGQYSKVIECPQEFKPQFMSRNFVGGTFSYYVGYANKNKVAGACASDQIFYNHFYGLTYCKNKSMVYEIEGFFNLGGNSLNALIDNISCDEY